MREVRTRGRKSRLPAFDSRLAHQFLGALMDEQKKEKPKTVYVGGKNYPEKPSLMDSLAEGFATTDTRAQLEAIRKRRQKSAG